MSFIFFRQFDCVDINECHDMHYDVCQNGECKNLQGSFQCICNYGFTLTANRETCIDINECVRHNNVCNNGTCINSVGSYRCECYPGFKISSNNDCVGMLTVLLAVNELNLNHIYYLFQILTNVMQCRLCAEMDVVAIQ